MKASDAMAKLSGGIRAAALGLILSVAGQPFLPGTQAPVAWAQSTNPLVLNLIAVVQAGQPVGNLVTQLLASASGPALSSLVSSLFTSGGALGGSVGGTLAGLVVQAVQNNPGAQGAVGAGMGNAAVQLASSGNGSAATGILNGIGANAPAGLTTGLSTGVAQAVASIGGNSANAINAAAQGTSVAGAVSSGVQTAQNNPNTGTPGNTNPTCTSNCGSGN
jgi:hypothetical protein